MTSLSNPSESSTDLPQVTVNPNRIELDEAYMQMAEVWAKRSKANRSQVGALIIKDRQIISDGYNGMPSGVDDDVCEQIEFIPRGYPCQDHYPFEWEGRRYKLVTKPEVLHAESNALLKISENGGIGAQGATLYSTLSPCPECAKLIKQAKIRRVVFRNQYRDMSGVELLKKLGVEVEHLSNEVVESRSCDGSR